MSFQILGHSFGQIEVYRNIFISQRIKLKFDTVIQNWILILIFGSKSGLGDYLGQYERKPLFYVAFWPHAS